MQRSYRPPQPLRFLIIGALATLTHLVCALALAWSAPDLSVYLINAVAFAIAFLVSFYGHTYVTFRRGGSMARFLLVALAGFGLNNLLLHGGKRAGLAQEVALVLAIGLVPVFTYIASSLWAFSAKKPPAVGR